MSNVSYLNGEGADDPAYLEYFGLTRSPFRQKQNDCRNKAALTPEEVEARLGQTLAQPGLTILCGAGGSSESGVVERAIGRIDRDIPLARFASAPAKAGRFLARILEAFGFDSFDAGLPQYRNVLTAFLRHKAQTKEVSVILVEQAETLTEPVLNEIIRLMRNRSPDGNAHILLQARPEFADRAQELFSNLDCTFLNFASAGKPDVADYVFGRLNASGLAGRSLFTSPAIRYLEQISDGQTDLIDSVCHIALELACETEAKKVSKRILEQATEICTRPTETLSHETGEVKVLEMDVEVPVQRKHSALMMTRNGRHITRFELMRERLTIGRHRSNDIYIPRPGISLFHAIIVVEGTEVFLFDLRSTNGTYVNGQEVSRKKLKDGDVVFFGALSLTFCQGNTGISNNSQNDVLPGFTETVVLEEEETTEPTVYMQSAL